MPGARGKGSDGLKTKRWMGRHVRTVRRVTALDCLTKGTKFLSWRRGPCSAQRQFFDDEIYSLLKVAHAFKSRVSFCSWVEFDRGRICINVQMADPLKVLSVAPRPDPNLPRGMLLCNCWDGLFFTLSQTVGKTRRCRRAFRFYGLERTRVKINKYRGWRLMPRSTPLYLWHRHL